MSSIVFQKSKYIHKHKKNTMILYIVQNHEIFRSCPKVTINYAAWVEWYWPPHQPKKQLVISSMRMRYAATGSSKPAKGK